MSCFIIFSFLQLRYFARDHISSFSFFMLSYLQFSFASWWLLTMNCRSQLAFNLITWSKSILSSFFQISTSKLMPKSNPKASLFSSQNLSHFRFSLKKATSFSLWAFQVFTTAFRFFCDEGVSYVWVYYLKLPVALISFADGIVSIDRFNIEFIAIYH